MGTALWGHLFPHDPLHRAQGRLGIGVTVTAFIVSYGMGPVFLRLGTTRTRRTILENNLKQSTSSSGGTFHGCFGLPFFLGAIAGRFMGRRRPVLAERYNDPVASGVIAGGSLMGVALTFWENVPIVWRPLFGGG